MRCDSREIPDPLAAGEPRGWWIAAMAFAQEGYTTDPNVGLPTHQGICALTVAPSSFHAILAPQAATAPAVWVSADLSSLQVEASGTQGLFRKRPSLVEISAPKDGWSLSLAMVSRLYRASNRFQNGHEASLVEALRA